MALRSAVAAAPRGFRRFLCSASVPDFIPPPVSPTTPQREMPEPSTSLFVSGWVPGVRNFVQFIRTKYGDIGLSKRTSTEKLQEAFAKFGEVRHARVVTDRVTGYSKGFGFVHYATLEDAAKGIKGMDGKFLDGWVIFAEYARPKQPVNQPDGRTSMPYSNR